MVGQRRGRSIKSLTPPQHRATHPKSTWRLPHSRITSTPSSPILQLPPRTLPEVRLVCLLLISNPPGHYQRCVLSASSSSPTPPDTTRGASCLPPPHLQPPRTLPEVRLVCLLLISNPPGHYQRCVLSASSSSPTPPDTTRGASCLPLPLPLSLSLFNLGLPNILSQAQDSFMKVINEHQKLKLQFSAACSKRDQTTQENKRISQRVWLCFAGGLRDSALRDHLLLAPALSCQARHLLPCSSPLMPG